MNFFSFLYSSESFQNLFSTLFNKSLSVLPESLSFFNASRFFSLALIFLSSVFLSSKGSQVSGSIHWSLNLWSQASCCLSNSAWSSAETHHSLWLSGNSHLSTLEFVIRLSIDSHGFLFLTLFNRSAFCVTLPV
jgi:hypothetical protein